MLPQTHPVVLAAFAATMLASANSITRLSGQSDPVLCAIVVNAISLAVLVAYHYFFIGSIPSRWAPDGVLEFAIIGLTALFVLARYLAVENPGQIWTSAGLTLLVIAGLLNAPGVIASTTGATMKAWNISNFSPMCTGFSITFTVLWGVGAFKEGINLTKMSGVALIIGGVFFLTRA